MGAVSIILYVTDGFGLLFAIGLLVIASVVTAALDDAKKELGVIRSLFISVSALFIGLASICLIGVVGHLATYRGSRPFGALGKTAHVFSALNAGGAFLVAGLIGAFLDGGAGALVFVPAALAFVRGVAIALNIVSGAGDRLPQGRAVEDARSTYILLTGCLVASVALAWATAGLSLTLQKRTFESTTGTVTVTIDARPLTLVRVSAGISALAWTALLVTYVLLGWFPRALTTFRVHVAHAIAGCVASYTQILTVGAAMFFFTQSASSAASAIVWVALGGSVTALGVAIAENVILYPLATPPAIDATNAGDAETVDTESAKDA